MSKDILSDVVIHNKYAKHNGKGRESWTDLCMRYGNMMVAKYPDLEDEIWKAVSLMMSKSIVPSMRGIQFAGKPIDLSPNRMFNCAGMNVTTRRVFGETMFLLLGGSGVGYSVQKRHINQLGSIKEPKGEVRYVVQDSIVG